jgi:hypothetical protein
MNPFIMNVKMNELMKKDRIGTIKELSVGPRILHSTVQQQQHKCQ